MILSKFGDHNLHWKEVTFFQSQHHLWTYLKNWRKYLSSTVTTPTFISSWQVWYHCLSWRISDVKYYFLHNLFNVENKTWRGIKSTYNLNDKILLQTKRNHQLNSEGYNKNPRESESDRSISALLDHHSPTFYTLTKWFLKKFTVVILTKIDIQNWYLRLILNKDLLLRTFYGNTSIYFHIWSL